MEKYQLSETTENYLKEIHLLVIKYGSARISDIAKTVGRSLSTVTGAVQRMATDGLVNYEKYGKITLTDDGKILAKQIIKNFTILSDLLISLGIEEEQANIDACEMEHISEESMAVISDFLKFLKNDENGKNVLQRFNETL